MGFSTLEVTLISSCCTLGGVLVAGIYSLRVKRNEYVNDYYKKVIDRRMAAYEALESLVINLKIAVLDDDKRPHHFLFAKYRWPEVHQQVFQVMSQALWLSDEAFENTVKLSALPT